MIKIISTQRFPNDIVLAATNLCNEFNAKGLECVLYGLDNWHLNKCRSEPISGFKLRPNDIVIVFDYPITSYDDFFNLNKKVRNLYVFKKNKFFKKIKILLKERLKKVRNYFRGIYYRKFKNVKFILSVQGVENIDLVKVSKFYDKIHFVGKDYLVSEVNNSFICPNFGRQSLKFFDKKPSVIAAIIGDIYSDNNLVFAIENAVKDGMDKVVIYGFMRDPIYFYKNIEPLFKKYSGKLEMAGFSENYQEILDSVSDVYFYPAKKNISYIPHYCQLSNTSLHANENVLAEELLEKENIFAVWKKELNI